MKYTIKNGEVSAKIDTFGAQLSSFKDAEFEYLWQGDEKFWLGQAPVLFPCVGGLRNGKTQFGGKEFSMKRHGVAKFCEFSVAESSETAVTFLLKSNAETLKSYPFEFEFFVKFELFGKKLVQTYLVKNVGNAVMPFAVGGHPAFNCPTFGESDFADCVVEFEQNETVHCPLVSMETGLIDFQNRGFSLNNEKTINLRHDLFYSDALVFDSLKSNSVKFYGIHSKKGIKAEFGDFKYLGIWSGVNNAPFLAIEPWSGCATCTDEDDDFAKKRGITLLEPNKTAEFSFSMEIL
ncbi:MAG: aldose 1-epimerase family protein [Oscillospiraceae bacterium]